MLIFSDQENNEPTEIVLPNLKKLSISYQKPDLYRVAITTSYYWKIISGLKLTLSQKENCVSLFFKAKTDFIVEWLDGDVVHTTQQDLII